MQSFPRSPGGHLWLTCNFITFWSKNLRSFWWFFVHFHVPPKYIKIKNVSKLSVFNLPANLFFFEKVIFCSCMNFKTCYINTYLAGRISIFNFQVKSQFFPQSSFLFMHELWVHFCSSMPKEEIPSITGFHLVKF